MLGPILYAIFVSPMFDLAKMTLFADDNYLICWNKTIQELIDDMTKTIELVIKWLRQSGLKVNDSKTELCLFYRKDTAPITITVFNETLISKKPHECLRSNFRMQIRLEYS